MRKQIAKSVFVYLGPLHITTVSECNIEFKAGRFTDRQSSTGTGVQPSFHQVPCQGQWKAASPWPGSETRSSGSKSQGLPPCCVDQSWNEYTINKRKLDYIGGADVNIEIGNWQEEKWLQYVTVGQSGLVTQVGVPICPQNPSHGPSSLCKGVRISGIDTTTQKKIWITCQATTIDLRLEHIVAQKRWGKEETTRRPRQCGLTWWRPQTSGCPHRWRGPSLPPSQWRWSCHLSEPSARASMAVDAADHSKPATFRRRPSPLPCLEVPWPHQSWPRAGLGHRWRRRQSLSRSWDTPKKLSWKFVKIQWKPNHACHKFSEAEETTHKKLCSITSWTEKNVYHEDSFYGNFMLQWWSWSKRSNRIKKVPVSVFGVLC